MPAWIYPAVTAAAGLVGQGIASGKDKRQLVQQGKLNEQQIEANTKMLGIQNEAALEMWRKTGPQGQMEQLKAAGLNPGLLYGMGGAGGQSMGSQTANVGATKAQGRTGNETEQAGAIGMQLMSQIELMQAQKDNIKANTEKTKQETLESGEDTLSKQYDNIIKDLTVNRDQYGNEIMGPEDDNKRLAFQQKINEAVQVALKNKNIDQDTQNKIADIAQRWKSLDLDERRTAVMELSAGEQKDQDQLIRIIDLIVGIATRGFIGGRKTNVNVTDQSYRPSTNYNQR